MRDNGLIAPLFYFFGVLCGCVLIVFAVRNNFDGRKRRNQRFYARALESNVDYHIFAAAFNGDNRAFAELNVLYNRARLYACNRALFCLRVCSA